jgi:CheY-like chemotaxis protein
MKVLDNESRRQVLLVEDDDVLRRNYETLLSAHRLSVTACANKAEAMTAFGKHAFDVIILDVTLEGAYEGGFELCQQFREQQKVTPIIFLTERDEEIKPNQRFAPWCRRLSQQDNFRSVSGRKNQCTDETH